MGHVHEIESAGPAMDADQNRLEMHELLSIISSSFIGTIG